MFLVGPPLLTVLIEHGCFHQQTASYLPTWGFRVRLRGPSTSNHTSQRPKPTPREALAAPSASAPSAASAAAMDCEVCVVGLGVSSLPLLKLLQQTPGTGRGGGGCGAGRGGGVSANWSLSTKMAGWCVFFVLRKGGRCWKRSLGSRYRGLKSNLEGELPFGVMGALTKMNSCMFPCFPDG